MRTANVRTIVIWTLVALVGAWMVAAAVGSYAIGCRFYFYAKSIAHKLIPTRAEKEETRNEVAPGGRTVRKEIPPGLPLRLMPTPLLRPMLHRIDIPICGRGLPLT